MSNYKSVDGKYFTMDNLIFNLNLSIKCIEETSPRLTLQQVWYAKLIQEYVQVLFPNVSDEVQLHCQPYPLCKPRPIKSRDVHNVRY